MQMFPKNSILKVNEIRTEQSSNITLKCRGCLVEQPDMNSLFVKFEENTTLAKIIEESIGYVISQEERFSEYLCKKCTRIIVDFVRFKTTFRKATEYFKNFKILHTIGENTKNMNAEGLNDDNKNEIPFLESKIEQRKATEFDCEQLDNINSNNLNDVQEIKKNSKVLYLGQGPKESKKVTCELCNKLFKSRIQLQKHIRTTHKKNPFRSSKKTHLIPKSTSEQPLKQLEEPAIENDQISINPKSKILCKVCKHTFPSEEFELHLESHKIHVCNTCGHKFIRKTDLNDHKETHLEICKYVCQHCGKTFKVRTALNKHKRIHTNPREEICDVCGQRFNTRDTLKTHYKLKHIKSKDFQCNLCGLAFTLKSTLEKHIERHNPNRQRIYSCNLCNVSYINKYNLSRHHVIKHTAFENKPTCEFCGKGYIKKIDLVKHIKKHHGQIESGEQSVNKTGKKLKSDK